MYSGALVLLYLKTQDEWNIIGGLRSIKLNLNNQLIDSSFNNESPWKELITKAGLKQLTISCAGAFSNSKAENEMQELAFTGKIAEYKLIYPAGNSLNGNFQVSSYQRIAKVDEEESYSIVLVSSGKVFFIG